MNYFKQKAIKTQLMKEKVFSLLTISKNLERGPGPGRAASRDNCDLNDPGVWLG